MRARPAPSKETRWIPRSSRSWIDQRLVLRRSRIHGFGIFTNGRIAKHERIAIFGGDVMFIDELSMLPDAAQELPMQIEERFVLGSRRGDPEWADFFNHSCVPNVGFQGQIFLVAMRDITVDEELRFDYAMVVSPSVGSTIAFRMRCRCRTRACRRVITEDDWRLPALRRRYAGYFSRYIADLISRERENRTCRRRGAP